jgi:hypothetical protein
MIPSFGEEFCCEVFVWIYNNKKWFVWYKGKTLFEFFVRKKWEKKKKFGNKIFFFFFFWENGSITPFLLVEAIIVFTEVDAKASKPS